MKELFFDIETIPGYKYNEIPEGLKRIWDEKHYEKHHEAEIKFREKRKIDSLPNEEEIWNKYSPLYPEFGKVICISIGLIKDNNQYDIKTIKGEEENMLKTFFDFLNKNLKYILTGVNIKGFDIPYLVRKSFKYNLDLPEQLKVIGKKPWEIKVIDISEDYKCGMFNMVSLDLMCEFLGIQTPKDKFANYEVSSKFMSGEITLNEVTEYCEKDVRASMDVFKRIYM